MGLISRPISLSVLGRTPKTYFLAYRLGCNPICSDGFRNKSEYVDQGEPLLRAQRFRSEKLQNESSRIIRIFFPNFLPEFCSEFSPKFSRTFRASFHRRRRPEKIHQKSPPFFNVKFPGKHKKTYSQNSSGEQAKQQRLKKKPQSRLKCSIFPFPEGPGRYLDVLRQKLSPHCLETIFDLQQPLPKLSPKMPPKLSLAHKRGHCFFFQNYPPPVRVIARQLRDKNGLAAFFGPTTSRCLFWPTVFRIPHIK